MISKELLGFLSVGLSAIGYSTYIISGIETAHQTACFLVVGMGVLMGIVFFAQFSKHAGPGAWVTGFSAIVCFVSSQGLALFRGEKNITKGDWLAFAGALLTIPIWYATEDPLWVVILATLIDVLAYYPTFRKSWIRPKERENFFSFSMDVCKWLAALTALTDLFRRDTYLSDISAAGQHYARDHDYWAARGVKNALQNELRQIDILGEIAEVSARHTLASIVTDKEVFGLSLALKLMSSSKLFQQVMCSRRALDILDAAINLGGEFGDFADRHPR